MACRDLIITVGIMVQGFIRQTIGPRHVVTKNLLSYDTQI